MPRLRCGTVLILSLEKIAYEIVKGDVLLDEVVLHGVNPQGVIDIIKARRARGSQCDEISDGRKLALVIEGGALRAISSAGGAYVLAELGLSDVFDEVYATSAGVMNASYFISGQPLLGISVYFENCTSRKFINPFRFWKILDVDYIFDQVVPIEKPLDVARVLGTRTRLYVAVIDSSSGEAFVVDTKKTRTPLVQVLKAANAIPVYYNRTVAVDGRPCIDGGIGIPFPLAQALENGCTDVLVLSTKPVSYVSQQPSWKNRMIFNMIFAQGNEVMSRVFNDRHLRSREARNLALGRLATPQNVSIATVCTEGIENIDRLTTNRTVLYDAAVSYGRKVLRIFGEDANSWTLPDSLLRSSPG